LLPRWGHRKGCGTAAKLAWHEGVGQAIVDTIGLSVRQAYGRIKAAFGAAITFSESTLRRLRQRWADGNRQLHSALHSPTDWRNRFLSAVGSYTEGIVRPNQRWEMDWTVLDAFEVGGKRWSLLVVEDVFSRRVIPHLAPTANAEDIVAGGMREAILRWGIPEEIKLDNGKDFRSQRVEHAAGSLGIRLNFCQVRSPWQKPHVERFMGTAMRWLRGVPGFAGHCVADRKLLESQGKVRGYYSAPELGELMRGLVEEYENTLHSTLGRTPLEQWATSPTPVRLLADSKALDILLAPRRVVTVTKRGIQFDNAYYFDDDGRLAELIGQQVEVRTDEDAGILHVFEVSARGDGAFVMSVVCVDRLGNRQKTARSARRLQARILRKARQMKRRAQQLDREFIDGQYLSHRRRRDEEQIAATDRSPKVVPMQSVVTVDFPAAASAATESTRLRQDASDPVERVECLQEESEAERYHRLATTRGLGHLNDLSEIDIAWLDRMDGDPSKFAPTKKMLSAFFGDASKETKK
jgi:putative transposase